MRRPPSQVAKTLAANVRRLMDERGISQNALAGETKLGQSTLSGLLGAAAGTQNPRADTIEKIATYFRVEPWRLFVPSATAEFMADQQVGKLLGMVARMDAKSRNMILSVAEGQVALSRADDGQELAEAS